MSELLIKNKLLFWANFNPSSYVFVLELHTFRYQYFMISTFPTKWQTFRLRRQLHRSRVECYSQSQQTWGLAVCSKSNISLASNMFK